MAQTESTSSADTGDADMLALIPAYNEASKIVDVITASQELLPVLVVDDGSTDDTAKRAEAAGATVLVQNPNQGKGAALQAGFRWAMKHGYRAVLTLDADGQHAPGDIPQFMEADRDRRPDLIIGARDFHQMPLVRRMSNTLGRWSLSWAMGRHIRDNQSGYRLLSRRMMEAVTRSDERGFEFEVEMIIICTELGYSLDWVPIRTIYADETSHIRPWQHAANFLRLVRQTRRRVRQGARRPS